MLSATSLRRFHSKKTAKLLVRAEFAIFALGIAAVIAPHVPFIYAWFSYLSAPAPAVLLTMGLTLLLVTAFFKLPYYVRREIASYRDRNQRERLKIEKNELQDKWWVKASHAAFRYVMPFLIVLASTFVVFSVLAPMGFTLFMGWLYTSGGFAELSLLEGSLIAFMATGLGFLLLLGLFKILNPVFSKNWVLDFYLAKGTDFRGFFKNIMNLFAQNDSFEASLVTQYRATMIELFLSEKTTRGSKISTFIVGVLLIAWLSYAGWLLANGLPTLYTVMNLITADFPLPGFAAGVVTTAAALFGLYCIVMSPRFLFSQGARLADLYKLRKSADPNVKAWKYIALGVVSLGLSAVAVGMMGDAMVSTLEQDMLMGHDASVALVTTGCFFGIFILASVLINATLTVQTAAKNSLPMKLGGHGKPLVDTLTLHQASELIVQPSPTTDNDEEVAQRGGASQQPS